MPPLPSSKKKKRVVDDEDDNATARVVRVFASSDIASFHNLYEGEAILYSNNGGNTGASGIDQQHSNSDVEEESDSEYEEEASS